MTTATNAAIGAYLRAWADEVERERKTWTDMWGPNFRHMTPTEDMLDRAGRLGTKASELRSRADEVDPPCVACHGRGEHAAWCETRFREPAPVAAGGES